MTHEDEFDDELSGKADCNYAAEGYPAAYSVDALTGAELLEFRAHLPTCETCTAEVAALRGASAQLAYALDDEAVAVQPSAELRTRILAAIAEDESEQALPTPTPLGRRVWLPQAYAVAAVLLLMFGLGLLAWNLSLQRDLAQAHIERDQAREALARWQLSAAGNSGASGEVVYVREQQQAVIVTRGLPALAPGQVYQLWLIPRDGKPQPSTVFLATTTGVVADLDLYQTIAVTIEPGPTGSQAPTSSPVLAGALGQ